MAKSKRVVLIGSGTHHGHGVVEGIDKYCREFGRWEYHLCRDNSTESVAQAKSVIEHWKPNGIIASIQHDRVERLIRHSKLPAVNVTGHWRPVPSVCCDNEEVGRLAAEYFLGNGLRHFAFMALTPEPAVRARHAGFERRVKALGYACNALTWLYEGMRDSQWARNQVRLNRWLVKLRKPTALMCAYDPFAQIAAFACRQLGLRVPDEVAILGVGNEEFFCRLSTPQLSSVDQNRQRIGYEAARMLDRMMRGRSARGPVLVPPGRVIVRQSSDIIAIDDADIAAAVRFIRETWREPVSVKDLLRVVPVSRKTLERRFKKLIGRTPREEIVRVHMEHAMALLEQTDEEIPRVAAMAGFSGRSLFATHFRREMGISPTEYRSRIRANGCKTKGFLDARSEH